MQSPTQNVAQRIDALLARVAGIRRGSAIDRPTQFNADGERHACEVARRDAKAVDTGVVPGAAGHVNAEIADVSSPTPAAAEPVTGTSSRLRPRKGC